MASAVLTVEGETSDRVTGKANVVGLGFVTETAEYMVAADVLVSKAGPGTIAKDASVGLLAMLTRGIGIFVLLFRISHGLKAFDVQSLVLYVTIVALRCLVGGQRRCF